MARFQLIGLRHVHANLEVPGRCGKSLETSTQLRRLSGVERSQVLELLHDHMAELTGMGVKSLALFGSVARDEATPSSDVDQLVEFSVPVGLFEYFAVRERLEEILGTRVDMVTPGGLKPRVRERVLREAISAT